jgi:hypothetical protein
MQLTDIVLILFALLKFVLIILHPAALLLIDMSNEVLRDSFSGPVSKKQCYINPFQLHVMNYWDNEANHT